MGRMIGTRHRARDDGERDALDHDVRAFVGHGRRCARARVTSRRTHHWDGWDRDGWRRAKAHSPSFIFIVLLRVVYGERNGGGVVCLWFSVDPLV